MRERERRRDPEGEREKTKSRKGCGVNKLLKTLGIMVKRKRHELWNYIDLV